MIKLLNDIYTWSVYSEEKNLNFNGWFIHNNVNSEGNVIIDPPGPSNKVLEKIEEMGGVQHILITNQHHIRKTSIFQEKFNSKLYINQLDASKIELPIHSEFNDGDLLAEFLKAVHVPHQKTPGETALYWEDRRILFVGDAIIGDPAGRLRLLPKTMYADFSSAKEGLKVLLDFDFSALLVGDGDSIISGGKTALTEYLNKK